jgi:chromosome partitioning protein
MKKNVKEKHARIAKVIAVCSNKGGVGKTTGAAALGHAFSLKGYRVLMIDADPQGNLAGRFGQKKGLKGEKSLYAAIKNYLTGSALHPSEFIVPTPYENIDIITGDDRLSVAKSDLASASSRFEFIYKDIVDKIIELGIYDYIIFDTRPSLEDEITQVLIAAQWIIIPITTGIDSIDGMNDTIRFQLLCRRGNKDLQVAGVFFNRVKSRTSVAKEIIPAIQDQLKDYLFETIVSEDEKAIQSENMTVPITAYNPNGKAAKEFLDLAEEVLKKIG